MSIKRRAKSAVRRRAAKASVALPAARGPAGWQHLVGRARVAEARRVLRADHDPAGALELVQPLLDDRALRSRVWALVAEAREKQGDRAGALAAARTAVDGCRRGLHRSRGPPAARGPGRLDGRGGRGDGTAGRHPPAQRPRAPGRADRAAHRWASRGPAAARQPRALGHLTGWDEQLDELDAEIDLRAATDDRFEGELARVTDRLSNPLPVVARVLDERRSWARLAAYADDHPPVEPTVTARRAAALELRKAAARALTAGSTASAERLAGHALALHPDDAFAQETWASAADQLRVVRDGWTAGVPASGPRYAARPEAVLSVLAQSLPHQSGGYATRSHGVLTGLDALGWDVEAVTRLGFPYDRWPKGDTRQVPAYDVVDGIRYSRLLEGERRRYPQYPLGSYVDRYAAAIQQHARRHRPALLHASSFHVNGLATQLAAARLGVPYVYEMRGLEDLMKVSRDPSFDGSDRRRFLDTVEGAVVRRRRAGVRDHRGAQDARWPRGACPRRSWWCCPTACTPSSSSRASATPRSRRRWACAGRP